MNRTYSALILTTFFACLVYSPLSAELDNGIFPPESTDVNEILSVNILDARAQQTEIEEQKESSQKARLRPGLMAPILDQMLIDSSNYIFPQMEAAFACGLGARPKNEDYHLVQQINLPDSFSETELMLLAVFDGHGGAKAAQFCSENIGRIVKELLIAADDAQLSDTTIFSTLKKSVLLTDSEFLLKKPKSRSGCTATICLLLGQELWVANVGDSRALWVDSNRTMQLSKDMSLTDPVYQDSVQALGGEIISIRGNLRVNGKIGMPRAIGDHHVVSNEGVCCISAEPVITRYKIESDGILIIACDGVFDAFSSDESGEFVQDLRSKHTSLENICSLFVKEAFKKGSGDNCTAVALNYLP
jgi:serine/threonine protein phosphatase PrpC